MNTPFVPVLPLRTSLSWLSFLCITLLLISCTKQIAPLPDEALRAGISPARAQDLGGALVTNAYPEPAVPWGPVWTSNVYPLAAGGTELEEASLMVCNDYRALYLSLWRLPWQPSAGNLKLWIDLAANAPALSSMGQVQRLRYPVTLTVEPGTECYCVEIGFAELSEYLQAPVDCNSDVVVVLQADVAVHGKTLKAWAGDASGGRGAQSWRWVSRYDAQCFEMPPPPEGSR